MANHQVLLVHEDASLPFHLEQGLGARDAVVSIPARGRAKRNIGRQHFPLVVVEGGERGYKNLQRLYRLNGKTKNSAVLLASSSMLQRYPEMVRELSMAASDHSTGTGPSKSSARSGENLFLKDFIELKLRTFVSHMKLSGVRNLHSMLLAEVERPLISYILKETRGNQVQAARLLGMNRNTLRKRIKDLKIPADSKSSPRRRK